MPIQFLPRACAAPIRSRRFHRIARALPLAAVLAWLPAQAQTGDAVHHVPEGEGAITVDGVRQAYRGDFSVKEIPQAITEIDAETLQQNNILRLTDALDMNASVARQNTLGGLWDSFAIRGFAAMKICRAAIWSTASTPGAALAASATWPGSNGSRCSRGRRRR